VEETATPSTGIVEAVDPVVATVIDGSAIDEVTTTAVTEAAPAVVPDQSAPGSDNHLLARTEPRDAPYCYQCGNAMQRAGSCYVCSSCGTTSGCS
jgi:ribonucleoside-diphosphate reductase alpha chain